MDPRLTELRELISRRTKSTDNIFFHWRDVGKAFHVHRNTVLNWQRRIGRKLPLTRVFIENWLRNRRVLTSDYTRGRMVRILEQRILDNMTKKASAQVLRMSTENEVKYFRAAWTRYGELQPLSKRGLPKTREEAWAQHRSQCRERMIDNLRRKQ